MRIARNVVKYAVALKNLDQQLGTGCLGKMLLTALPRMEDLLMVPTHLFLLHNRRVLNKIQNRFSEMNRSDFWDLGSACFLDMHFLKQIKKSFWMNFVVLVELFVLVQCEVRMSARGIFWIQNVV